MDESLADRSRRRASRTVWHTDGRSDKDHPVAILWLLTVLQQQSGLESETASASSPCCPALSRRCTLAGGALTNVGNSEPIVAIP